MPVDISVIITAHKEGELLYPTAQSAMAAITSLLARYSVEVSVLIYLDNPDKHTEAVAMDLASVHGFSVLAGSNGDPGQARLDAVKNVDGQYIALLDGDDLWSDNWLALCWEYLLEHPVEADRDVVLHPEYNLIFGAHNLLVRQGDSSSSFFDQDFLRLTNYWDALCFASRRLFLDCPYQKNDVSAGFAHEDYLWMCETLANGVAHVLVKNAVHFKRRRAGSVSQFAEEKKVKVKFNSFSFYRD